MKKIILLLTIVLTLNSCTKSEEPANELKGTYWIATQSALSISDIDFYSNNKCAFVYDKGLRVDLSYSVADHILSLYGPDGKVSLTYKIDGQYLKTIPGGVIFYKRVTRK